jgi:hypothetical protein
MFKVTEASLAVTSAYQDLRPKWHEMSRIADTMAPICNVGGIDPVIRAMRYQDKFAPCCTKTVPRLC